MRLRVLILAVLVVGLIPLAAQPAAATTIDFRDALLPPGGAVTWHADGNVSGANIPIGAMLVALAPLMNGSYIVTNGLLSFSTGGMGGNFITITGTVVGLLPNPVMGTLLSGIISSFDASMASNGLVSAQGTDTKNANLLLDIGLSPGTLFNLFGFSLTTTPLTQGGPSGSAISTDIRNISVVPEPATLAILGAGLIGLAFILRRRLGVLGNHA